MKLTSFRTTDDIRAKLAAAAAARGVSVNREINDRIAASFTRAPIATDMVKLVAGMECARLILAAQRWPDG